MENRGYELELKKLGLVIKDLRVDKGITQEYLSTICEVDVRTIQRIEKGKQNITLKLLFTISDKLNIKPDILISKIFDDK